MPRKKKDSGQLSIDFEAAEKQAAELPARLTKFVRQDLIRYAGIPDVPFCEGKTRRVARGCDIKHLLRVIDDRNQVFGISTIMLDTGWDNSKAWRVVRGAIELSVIVVDKAGRTDVFRIVHSELALRMPEAKLRRMRQKESAPTQQPTRPHSASEAPPLVAPPLPTAQPTRPHSASEAPPTGGANRLGNPSVNQSIKPPPPTSHTTTSDVTVIDGAWYEEFWRVFDRFAAVVPCKDLRDINLLVKICLLLFDRQLSENAVEEVLESLEDQDNRDELIENPAAFLWTAMWNQCRDEGESLKKLLFNVKVPTGLIEQAAGRATINATKGR